MGSLVTVSHCGKKFLSEPARKLVCKLVKLCTASLNNGVVFALTASHTSGTFNGVGLCLRPISFFVWRNDLGLKNQRSCPSGMGEIFGFPGSDHSPTAPRSCHHVNLHNVVGEPLLVNLFASEMSFLSLERSPNRNSEIGSTVDGLQRTALVLVLMHLFLHRHASRVVDLMVALERHCDGIC